MFEQGEHEAGSPSDQGSQRWKAKFPRFLRVNHRAFVWFWIDSLALNLNPFLGFLPIHFSVDTVAGSICENLEGFIQSIRIFPAHGFLFCHGFALFDHRPKKVLGSRVYPYFATEADRSQVGQLSHWNKLECVDNLGNLSSKKNGGDHVRKREPETF